MADGTRLLVLRHGQSTWNAEGLWQGQADPPLSELGEAQAANAAGRLAGQGLDGPVASDLQRARRTAEIIADALGLGPVALDPGLREVDVGEWQGLTRPQIEERWPGLIERWSDGRAERPPGGESRAELARRAMHSLARLAAVRGPGGRVLVVTHGGLIRTVDRVLGVEPARISNLAGRWYEVGGGGAVTAGELVSLVDEDG